MHSIVCVQRIGYITCILWRVCKREGKIQPSTITTTTTTKDEKKKRNH